ncbi:hypothetical protein [Thermogemmatispora carboxidivorans]|uniref:hypothetical protein n=1 Tax=Thermogemmatispora carboxidivorans TaxID=1382306 RepID=UPI0012DF0F9D|nr:hypothetical protein [Thermogemmatispora carboxidivorans]
MSNGEVQPPPHSLPAPAAIAALEDSELICGAAPSVCDAPGEDFALRIGSRHPAR